MTGATEKFTIQIVEQGVLVIDQEGRCISFTAGEALMLLDILRCEEIRLREMAEKASPFPIHIHV